MTEVVPITRRFASPSCECCSDGAYIKIFERQQFPYGDGANRVALFADVPIWRCDQCGDAYTDFEAENARHAAVCEHLGRLSPSQLVSLRQRHALTQDEWSQHTQIGLASIKRWETGVLIQGASTDAYLRLLDDGIGYARHVAIQRALRKAEPPIFRSTFSSVEIQEARTFQLRLRRA